MTPGQYLREIINTAKDMLDEEGQHNYNLIVDEEELESCYDKLTPCATRCRTKSAASTGNYFRHAAQHFSGPCYFE